MINQRLRKLEKSDSEKTEEIGRLNRIIGQKDKEIHSLKMDLATFMYASMVISTMKSGEASGSIAPMYMR